MWPYRPSPLVGAFAPAGISPKMPSEQLVRSGSSSEHLVPAPLAAAGSLSRSVGTHRVRVFAFVVSVTDRTELRSPTEQARPKIPTARRPGVDAAVGVMR